MVWAHAQHVLIFISFVAGAVGFVGSLIGHRMLDHGQYDWLERIARSLFAYIQCALWSNVVAFIVLDNFFDINFGGVK